MLKKFTTLFFILVCASFFKANAQNCTIVSPDFACLGDPVTFKVVLAGGGTPTSYSWKLDPDTSSQSNVSTTYSTPGIKNISITVKLPGGGTCVATKQITIHDPPNTNFQITSNSSFCRKTGEVCIDDLTTLGVTGVPVEKVIVVWGDGNADSSSIIGKQYCHKYLNSGTFTITMEVRNNKGCTKKIEQKVVIGEEFDLKYKTDTFYEWCDSIRICFRNLNTPNDVGKPLNKQDAKSLIWDFGDGEKDTSLSSFNTVCHTYKKEGVFQHNFTVTSKSGCNNTYTETIDTPYYLGNPIYNSHFSDYDFTITVDKDSACYDEQIFSYSTEAKLGVEYEWGYKFTTNPSISYGIFSGTNQGLLYAGKTGPSYVRMRAYRGECVYDLFDTIYVCGPIANIDARNKKQCKLQDTVYFCDNSDYTCVTQLYRLWDFDDDNAPQCTTDLANNINVGMNCNYSKDPLPQHYYSDTGCYDPKVYLYDSALMCGDVDSILIEMGTIDASKLNINYKLPCEGNKLDYVFQFDIGRENCIIPYAEINFDSACGKDRWYPFQGSHIYNSHCQEDDSVTIGLALKFGEPVRYRSCKLGDNFYDPDNVCYDTVWYHDQFKLSPEPSINISKVVKSDSCIPFSVKTVLQDSTYPYPEIKYYEYRWKINEPIRDTFGPGDSIISLSDLVIDTFGNYHIFVRIENEAGCYDADSTDNFQIGFFSDFYIHNPHIYNNAKPWLSRDTLFCVGDTVLFGDSIRYFNSPLEPWRSGGTGETIHWDFGDGGGFTAIGPLPIHTYQAPGIYQIKMAARDKNGCWDTIAHPVYISGVEAGVKTPTQAYLCDDIVQFFDSSQIKLNLQNDSIVAWFWRYSDGKPDNFVKNPFHSFTSNGFFTVTHAVTTKFGCVDTVQSSIEILGPKPSFDIMSDTVGCVPFTVEFKNTSTDVFEWIWRFGDPGNTVFSTKGDTNITFTYTEPGWYNISLYGTDSLFNPATGSYKYCSATFPDSAAKPKTVRRVLVLPIPPVDFTMPTEVCVDEVFNINDQSDTIYEFYKWAIPQVNDSIISLNKQVSYQFSDTGDYTIVYTPTYIPIPPYQRYCFDTIQKIIDVQDVRADFILDTNKSNMPYFAFINTSSNNAVQFEWDFGHPKSGGDNYADSRDAAHDYQSDTGSYDVCLVAYSDLGCVDTACRTIKNRYFVYVIIPNVFTPENGDGFNDAFDIDIFGEELYDLVIYNRWGEVVFRGDTDGYGNDGINWDGTTPGGNKHPAGTYYFVFKYQLRGMDAPEEVSGVVTLIRPKN